MSREQTHQSIVANIDAIEADLFGLYRRLQALRVHLQNEWRVLPSNEPWTADKSARTRYSESQVSTAPAGER